MKRRPCSHACGKNVTPPRRVCDSCRGEVAREGYARWMKNAANRKSRLAYFKDYARMRKLLDPQRAGGK